MMMDYANETAKMPSLKARLSCLPQALEVDGTQSTGSITLFAVHLGVRMWLQGQNKLHKLAEDLVRRRTNST